MESERGRFRGFSLLRVFKRQFIVSDLHIDTIVVSAGEAFLRFLLLFVLLRDQQKMLGQYFLIERFFSLKKCSLESFDKNWCTHCAHNLSPSLLVPKIWLELLDCKLFQILRRSASINYTCEPIVSRQCNGPTQYGTAHWWPKPTPSLMNIKYLNLNLSKHLICWSVQDCVTHSKWMPGEWPEF